MPLDDFIERSPVPIKPPAVQDTITFRLTGKWLRRWQMYLETAGQPRKADVFRDCLALLFACASTDASGEPVEIILRRRDASGNQVPDEDLIAFLGGLPTVSAYREARKQQAKQAESEVPDGDHPGRPASDLDTA